MSDRGVSVEEVGQILAAGVGGTRQGKYTFDGKRYDIRFKIKDDMVKTPEDFKHLYVRNSSGNLIPFYELITIEEGNAIQAISRVNRQRAISVFGNLGPGQSQSKVLDRARAIATEILPPGYSFALEGASAGFASSFSKRYRCSGLAVYPVRIPAQYSSFATVVTRPRCSISQGA